MTLIIVFISSICGLVVLFAGLFFLKQRRYKKMYVNIVESIFILRKKQLSETFALFFELCTYYNPDDGDYAIWLEDQKASLKELMYRLSIASNYDGYMSMNTWFKTRDKIMNELVDFSLSFLAHSYISEKDDVLCAMDECVSEVSRQENYFYLDHFEQRYDMDWAIHIDKSSTIDFCTDAKNLIQKEINLYKAFLKKA